MRVGEVARRTGLSVRMVRYYEERRYLPGRPRTPQQRLTDVLLRVQTTQQSTRTSPRPR